MAPIHTASADPAVTELQSILVKHGLMTEDQVKTGRGILGPKTRAAVDHLLANTELGQSSSAAPPKPPEKPVRPTERKAGPIETRFYIVQAGESPEEIARRAGTTVNQLLAHPENAFMKERQSKGGYPLHPGDRIALPGTARLAPAPKSAPADPSVIDRLIEYLQELAQLHPAAAPQPGVGQKKAAPAPKKTVKKTSTATPTAPPSALPGQGYSMKHDRLNPGVVLTKAIESAFFVLLDYLPKSTMMTSGYRSDTDQARVINNYYTAYNGNPLEKDVEKRRQWLVTTHKLKIAPVGLSTHRTGLAFDLAGADVDELEKAVRRCAKEQGTRFPLLDTKIERASKQQCLHVDLRPTAAHLS